MMTINISMPRGLYKQAQSRAKKYHYASVSEVIRDSLRWWLNDNLTRNGFTPEFEEQVLKAAAEPLENDITWDGTGSFVEWSQSHPPKKYAKSKTNGKVLSIGKRIVRGTAGSGRRSKQESALVYQES